MKPKFKTIVIEGKPTKCRKRSRGKINYRKDILWKFGHIYPPDSDFSIMYPTVAKWYALGGDSVVYRPLPAKAKKAARVKSVLQPCHAWAQAVKIKGKEYVDIATVSRLKVQCICIGGYATNQRPVPVTITPCKAK